MLTLLVRYVSVKYTVLKLLWIINDRLRLCAQEPFCKIETKYSRSNCLSPAKDQNCFHPFSKPDIARFTHSSISQFFYYILSAYWFAVLKMQFLFQKLNIFLKKLCFLHENRID